MDSIRSMGLGIAVIHLAEGPTTVVALHGAISAEPIQDLYLRF